MGAVALRPGLSPQQAQAPVAGLACPQKEQDGGLGRGEPAVTAGPRRCWPQGVLRVAMATLGAWRNGPTPGCWGGTPGPGPRRGPLWSPRIPALAHPLSPQCVVIGLQSTGEARTREVLDEKEGQLDCFVSAAE